jgi:hypothetical protein
MLTVTYPIIRNCHYTKIALTVSKSKLEVMGSTSFTGVSVGENPQRINIY